MFLFFIALTIQALIEREVRNKMTKEGLASLNVYPEEREAVHPTTNKIFDRVEPLSTYSILEKRIHCRGIQRPFDGNAEVDIELSGYT